MKFLKINAKVLLILCLFSGILFLSTGCGDNEKGESKEPDAGQTDKETGDKDGGSSSSDGSTTDKDSTGSNTTSSSTNKEVDYTVWVANTTINTDKNQKSYKVIWGDTLWLISTAWEVPYQEIARYNNIPNPDLIYVDQVIYNPLFK